MVISSETPTNIHCIENVLFIQWHLFCLDSSSGPSSAPNIAFSSLDSAWSEFVQNGYYSCHSFRRHLLWVFELSSTFSSARVKTPLAEVARKHQLKKISFGSLRACDLDTGVRTHHAQPVPGHSHKPSQALPGSPYLDTSSPTTIDFDSKNIEGIASSFQATPKQIHDAFIAATYDLLTFSLAANFHVIPICANLYIQFQSQHHSRPGPADDATSFTNQLPQSYSLSVSSIGVEWLANGKLFIAACPSKSQLTPLSQHLRFFNRVPYGDSYIAPLGIKLGPCDVRRKKSDPDLRRHAGKSKRNQREAILEMLARRAIAVPDDDEWVICHFKAEAENLPPMLQGRCMMWPSSLIYVHVYSSSMDVCCWTDPRYMSGRFSLSDSFDGPDVEPAHSAHEKAVKDLMKDDFVHILQGLADTFGPGAVYPTPPELIRSQPASQPPRLSAFSAPTPATISSMHGPGEGQTPSVAQDFMSPDNDVDIRLGDDEDHDDLFGDLAIGMGTDVLNEDEFGFFDSNRPTSDHSAPAFISDKAQVATPKAEAAMSPPSPRTTKALLMGPPTKHIEPSLHAKDNKDSVMHDAPDTMIVAKMAPSKPKSLREIARKQSSLLDDKYAAGGIYNSLLLDHPLFKTPRDALPNLTAIPIITKANLRGHISDSDTDESSDEDYQDDYDHDDDNDDDDEDENQPHEPDDDDDEDMDEHEYNDSDTSMEGVEATPPSSLERPSRYMHALPSMVPIGELAMARTPMHICPPKLGSKGDSKLLMAELSSSSGSYIELAQIVMCQLSYGRGQHPAQTNRKPSQYNVLHVMGTLFDKTMTLDIQDCASVVKSKQQSDSPFSPSFPSNDTAVKIPTSDIVIERDGSRMHTSATTLSVWAELGLAPAGGQHNVQCYCFTPDTPAWLQSSQAVLLLLRNTFASMRLGDHDLGTAGALNSSKLDGIIGVEPADSFPQYKANLFKAANSFDKLIRGSDTDDHTDIILIYIINPAPESEVSALPALCSVFQKLQDSLAHYGVDLVLKILPASILAKDRVLSIPSPDQLTRLAREMYERISQASELSEPLTYLTPAIPGSVPIRLDPNPIRRPLDPDVVIHLAYSWSPNSPWLTFAITDAFGNIKYSTAYHVPWRSAQQAAANISTAGLPATPQPGTPNISSTTSQPPTPGGYPGHQSTPATPGGARPGAHIKDSALGRFVDAIRHLWSHLDKLFPLPKSGLQKLFVVKDAPPIHPQERAVWQMLGQSRPKMELTLLIMDVDCPVSLSEPSNTAGSRTQARPAGVANSGPATPRFGSVGTPGGGPRDQNQNTLAEESQARLVRASDECWAFEAKALFVCNIIGKLDVVPAANGAGYVVYRDHSDNGSGTGSERDGAGSSSVYSLRVIFRQAGPRGENIDMGAIFKAYRGLATISEIVGLEGVESGLPWHVAVARRSRTGLARCM